MGIIDPILLVVLLLFGLRGYFRGLFRESFSLLGLLIGFMVAVRYDEPVALFWSDYWGLSLILLRVLSFAGIFFVIYFAFSLTGWLLHRSAKLLFLQTANRIGGVLLGVGKGAAILALVIFFLASSRLVSQKTRQKIEESYLAAPLHQIAQGLIRVGRSSILPQEESSAAGSSATSSASDRDSIRYF